MDTVEGYYTGGVIGIIKSRCVKVAVRKVSKRRCHQECAKKEYHALGVQLRGFSTDILLLKLTRCKFVMLS